MILKSMYFICSFQSKGVRTVAVGIGRGINDDELLAIAMDDPHYIVKVDRFEQLKEKLDVILADSCQGMGHFATFHYVISVFEKHCLTLYSINIK